MRYQIRLSYDGTPFSGWQVQNNAPSVQGCLQDALRTLLKEDIAVTGAGRTDAGVNAINYIAHFDTSGDLDAHAIGYKLNAILPAAVRIHDISPAAPSFHARFDAVKRSYAYFIYNGKDPFAGPHAWRCPWKLDVEAMNRAAEKILGTRDFSCFEKTGSDNKTSICTVTYARWERYEPDHVRLLGWPSDAPYLVFRISADRFLRNMVRAIVGTLVEIGRGRQDETWIEEVLSSGDRSSAGESVPGNALFLTEVLY